MKRIAKSLVVLAILIANGWLATVWGAIGPITATPPSFGFTMTVTVPTIKLTPAIVSGLPKTSMVELGDLLPPGKKLTVMVAPSMFDFFWSIPIDIASFSYTSTFGDYRIAGKSVNKNLKRISGSAAVTPPVTETEKEIVILSTAFKTVLATELLKTMVPNPLFTASRAKSIKVTESIAVDYTRVWKPNVGADVSAAVKLTFSTSFTAKVDGSVLKSVTASPAKANAAVGMQNSTTVSTTYKAELTTSGLGSPVTISSSGATFKTASGITLGSTSKSMSKGPVSGGPVFFPTLESIPAGVVQAAYKAKVSHFFIVRPFTAGGVTKEARVTVALVSRSSAGFQITRVELRFKDGQRVKIFPRNARPEFEAIINYIGSGIVQMDCRGSGVTLASGVPFLRTTKIVREYFDPSGRKVIVCPGAPGNDVGAYFGSVRFINPKITFDEPVIRWMLGDFDSKDAQKETQKLPPLIVLNSPAPNSLIDEDSRFSWNAKGKNVLFYRVEFFKQPNTDSAPVTGRVVDATENSAAVSSIMLRNLTKGNKYYVRILGLNKDGIPVEVSALREVRY